jgi:hypothetical protein
MIRKLIEWLLDWLYPKEIELPAERLAVLDE